MILVLCYPIVNSMRHFNIVFLNSTCVGVWMSQSHWSLPFITILVAPAATTCKGFINTSATIMMIKGSHVHSLIAYFELHCPVCYNSNCIKLCKVKESLQLEANCLRFTQCWASRNDVTPHIHLWSYLCWVIKGYLMANSFSTSCVYKLVLNIDVSQI